MRMSDPDLRIGRLVGGKWRLERLLGEGATSTVYAATHRDDGRRAAIKMLRSALVNDRDVVELFLTEGYLVSAIEHPGVVKVHEHGVTDDGAPFLVLELLVGQTLDELRETRGGRIPLEEVMAIADAMMDTLVAVHATGIVHRDLKPHNVMVLDGGGIKILDFGLAKLRGRTADAAQDVVGTPSFMPPEQALGVTKKMDAQSDVWALGATLFFLLSGQPVHIARHATAMLLASASTRPRSLADAAPELPRPIVDVIDRALAYRKIDRWADMSAMRSAWHEAHPAWLPTLPPPTFATDPAFIDPIALVDAPPSRLQLETPLAVTLFDPRDLVLDVESAPSPVFGPDAPRASATPARPRRRWGTTVALAATALLTVGVVTAAVVLAADDRPSAARSATPPPAPMELPSARPPR
ncbi:MAG: putative serine/threonine protein kinase [Labilithrix sp.]|nr:putative serine/threonine protein kinase [Labilithrix sp.]